MPLAAELVHIPFDADEIMTQSPSQTVSIYEALAEILSKPTESLSLSNSKSTDRTLISEAPVSSTTSTTTTTTTTSTTTLPPPTTVAKDDFKVENSTLDDHDNVNTEHVNSHHDMTGSSSTENVLPLTEKTTTSFPKINVPYHDQTSDLTSTKEEFSTDSLTTDFDLSDLTNNLTSNATMTNSTNESEIETTKTNLRLDQNRSNLKHLKANSPNGILRNNSMKAFSSSTVPTNYSPRFSASNRIPILSFGSLRNERKVEATTRLDKIDLMTNRITKSGEEMFMFSTPSVYPIYRPEFEMTTIMSVFSSPGNSVESLTTTDRSFLESKKSVESTIESLKESYHDKSSTESLLLESSTKVPKESFIEKSSTDKISTKKSSSQSSLEEVSTESSTEMGLTDSKISVENLSYESSSESFVSENPEQRSADTTTKKLAEKLFTRVRYQDLLEEKHKKNNLESSNESFSNQKSIVNSSGKSLFSTTNSFEQSQSSATTENLKSEQVSTPKARSLIDFESFTMSSTVTYGQNKVETTSKTSKINITKSFLKEINDFTTKIPTDFTTLSKMLIDNINELTTLPDKIDTSTSSQKPFVTKTVTFSSPTTSIYDFLNTPKLSVSIPSPFKPSLPSPKHSNSQPNFSQLTKATNQPRERYVYAILPNNTVIRKIIQEHSTTENPHVIYGILPNKTVLKKFRNGTIVFEENTTRVEVLNIDPKSLTNPNSEFYHQPPAKSTIATTSANLLITEPTKTVFYQLISLILAPKKGLVVHIPS